MDFSKFKTSTWLMAGGGLGMIIFGLFFDWAKLDFMGVSASDGNAFDWTRGWISWILIVLVGVVAVASAIGKMPQVKLGLPLLMVLASALSVILLLTLVIAGPKKEGVELDAAIGLYLSFVSAIAALAGSVMNLKESGGSIADLKDPNKIKGAFGQGGN